jgi:hypothetical protein
MKAACEGAGCGPPMGSIRTLALFPLDGNMTGPTWATNGRWPHTLTVCVFLRQESTLNAVFPVFYGVSRVPSERKCTENCPFRPENLSEGPFFGNRTLVFGTERPFFSPLSASGHSFLLRRGRFSSHPDNLPPSSGRFAPFRQTPDQRAAGRF